MRFEDRVARAVESLPPELRAAVRNLDISVEDEHPDDPDLLGLYQGGDYGPDTVTIYRRPLEETFHDPAELEREIRITVLHELGHFFGLDEERLAELGYD